MIRRRKYGHRVRRGAALALALGVLVALAGLAWATGFPMSPATLARGGSTDELPDYPGANVPGTFTVDLETGRYLLVTVDRFILEPFEGGDLPVGFDGPSGYAASMDLALFESVVIDDREFYLVGRMLVEEAGPHQIKLRTLDPTYAMVVPLDTDSGIGAASVVSVVLVVVLVTFAVLALDAIARSRDRASTTSRPPATPDPIEFKPRPPRPSPPGLR